MLATNTIILPSFAIYKGSIPRNSQTPRTSFFIGILLVFFVFFAGIIGLNNQDINESTVFTSAGKILDTATSEINSASIIEGYYREFYIPEKLADGEDYNITIYNDLRMIKIEWNQGTNLMSNIQTNNTQGNISAGTNTIKNENGVVKINES
jgi:hypothetical protein